NDTVSCEEIKFGDNDTLSALVAKAIGADLLLILSNVPGLMDPNNGNAVIPIVKEINSDIKALASGTQNEMSVGGMVSKLCAAQIAMENKCGMFIGSGDDPELFQKMLKGDTVGTYFLPHS
ncbi:MAG: glutamate 5-kinase, partial [Verrucomicrobia bacterium]|nr:glutamate 5-kinase [Verrucomicrobiota bacterium]